MLLAGGLLAKEILGGDVGSSIDRVNKFLDNFISNKKETKATFTFDVSIKNITQEALKKMDDNLKMIMTGVTKTLKKMDLTKAEWKDITDVLEQSPVLQPLEDPLFRADKMLKASDNWSFTETGPDEGIIKEVQSWFRQLISDEDVLNTTKIDIDTLAKIVAATSIAIKSFENYLGGSEFNELTLIDVGIIRYPDIENPYFKVYRIKLTAWQQSYKALVYNKNNTGIAGEYNMRKYKPRDKILEGLKAELKEKAIQEAEDLFG